MEQYQKVVLKAPEGMHYITSQGKEGELILELVPNVIPMTSVVATDKDKYFTKITEQDREKVKKWLKGRIGKTDKEKRFLERANQAIQKVNYDYWIATIEPSVANEKIYYAEGEMVGVGFSCNQWNSMAKDYALDRGSRLANLYELFIWYALRIVNGLWTLNYVSNNSSSGGNYRNAPKATGSMEKTGARECGGYRDGQGNSYKIVIVEDGYELVGVGYNGNGDSYPVADVYYCSYPDLTHYNSSGVLVLTK